MFLFPGNHIVSFLRFTSVQNNIKFPILNSSSTTMVKFPCREDLPSREVVLYWTNRTLKVLRKIFYGVVFVFLLAGTAIMALVLTGLAHISDEKRKLFLKDVRDQMLNHFVNFIIVGINSLLEGHQNDTFLDYTTLGSQAKIMTKQENDDGHSFYSRNIFTSSTPRKTSHKQDPMNETGDLLEEGENLSLKDSAQNEVTALTYQSFKAY